MPAVVATSGVGHDPTHYPTKDDMGEGLLQRWITEVLRSLLAAWLVQKKVVALVGAHQFIYWVQFEPTTNVCPDVYVLPGVDPSTAIESWKVWESGIVPSFALEVVSRDRLKDYDRAPVRYAELGVRELVIYDPKPGSQRVTWQVYRRLRNRRFARVERSDGDRVFAKSLECWLRVVGEGDDRRLRIATGTHGDDIVPTEAEAERERADAERERADAEHAACALAEAKIAALEARLEALRRK